ncbi:MAG: Hint domain-containing protein [Gemmobacter sp.]
MPWYDLGNAFLLNGLPLGGGPIYQDYTLDANDPLIDGITGPVKAFSDGFDPNGNPYDPQDPGYYTDGESNPIDPGSLIWLGGTTYTVTNTWHSVGDVTTTNGPVFGGIHFLEITDGTNTFYLAFPNYAGDFIDPADFVSMEMGGIADYFTAPGSLIHPGYLAGQGELGSPPCFAAGTRIATPRGDVPVEALVPGDLVETLHHRPQPVAWIGRVWGGRRKLTKGASWRPWRIEAGALGPGMPARALVLSAQHRLLASGPEVARTAGVPAILVAVKHLASLPGIAEQRDAREVEYFHLLIERHAVVRADGAWAETLWPGPVASEALEASACAAPAPLCARVQQAGPALPLADGRTGRRLARRLLKTGAAVVDNAVPDAGFHADRSRAA